MTVGRIVWLTQNDKQGSEKGRMGAGGYIDLVSWEHWSVLNRGMA